MLKERYFTAENIDGLAAEMQAEFSPEARVKTSFALKKSALLVLDMQAYFLRENSRAFVPSAQIIVPRAVRLAAAFQARNLPVFLTKHENTPSDAGMMARWWRDVISPLSPLSAIIPELLSADAPIIPKTQYDAFHQTPLEEILRNLGVEQLVLTGVMTHLCVETTARSAFARGFSVVIPADTTATYNQEFHRASFRNLSHGFARITRSAAILEELRTLYDKK